MKACGIFVDFGGQSVVFLCDLLGEEKRKKSNKRVLSHTWATGKFVLPYVKNDAR